MIQNLYDTDFHAWAQQQARTLQAKDWAALDLNNLIEEVEDLAGRHRDALGSELKRLLVYLLKWHYQATHRSDSWLESIEQARQAIDELTDDYPSLADYPQALLPKAYQRARRQGARETKFSLATFPPESCPWDLDDIRREGWLPPDAEVG
jgi:uncharacterized protein DUF29